MQAPAQLRVATDGKDDALPLSARPNVLPKPHRAHIVVDEGVRAKRSDGVGLDGAPRQVHVFCDMPIARVETANAFQQAASVSDVAGLVVAVRTRDADRARKSPQEVSLIRIGLRAA